MDAPETGLRFEESGLAIRAGPADIARAAESAILRMEDAEVKTLLADLFRAFDGSQEVYFLGTIVLTQGHKQWEVADGQQRLANTSILIAAVRDYLMELGDVAGAQNTSRSIS